MRLRGRTRTVSFVAFVGLSSLAVAAACGGLDPSGPAEQTGQARQADPPRPPATAPAPQAGSSPPAGGPQGVVTLAFAGDVHFEQHLGDLLGPSGGSLGAITRHLASADLAMVNLESAIAGDVPPDPKELEVPEERYHFRTSPAALDLLADAGVDVASMANNHGADYGAAGVADTLRAIRRGPIAVVGIGRDRDAALTPYRTTVRGTDIAVLAADTTMREGSSAVWAAGPDHAGIAAARGEETGALLAAVRRAERSADVVVVYLHWGVESASCPTTDQASLARSLADAGADVVVGTHAHRLQGAGWLGDTYVSYGLANFVWYHDHQPETGVLRLRIEDGRVVGDDWVPARIMPDGRPVALSDAEAAAATRDWRRLNACTDLRSRSLSEFSAQISRIGPTLAARMESSHRPGCPMALADLRHLRMSYIGFDGDEHTGEMVVAADQAARVVQVFGRLYDARFPIRRMRLVDAYGGRDARSMAANNTSAYNCRTVAGSDAWSAHAFGRAIDINPVQNPYLSGAGIAPESGRRYAHIDRSAGAPVAPGVIRAGGVVEQAFARVGWEWGGRWAGTPDYQHFFAGPPS